MVTTGAGHILQHTGKVVRLDLQPKLLPHQFSGVLKKFNSFQNDVMVDAGFNLDRLGENFRLGGGAAKSSPWSGAVHGRRLGDKIFNIARARVHA